MAPWGKQRDSETNKNASSESLSTTPNDDVNDDEQHERTKMNEQNQRSHSVAKAEMGEKTQPWTKQEDLKLQHMQEKYGNKWATVASQLPGRTGQQCAQRWRHRVNPNIRREKWTKEEDEKVILMMFVLSFSRFKNHRHLSRESREIRRFERRKRETSLSSTSERSRGVETSYFEIESTGGTENAIWAFVTFFNQKFDFFFFFLRSNLSAFADKNSPYFSLSRTNNTTHTCVTQLAKLYDEHGQRWAIIARSLSGRTDQQCMGRWRRHLDPSVERGNWKKEEDEQLRKAFETHGARWAFLARDIEGRTAQQCRARFYQLRQIEEEREEEEEEKKKKKKKKRQTFSDEEEEKKEEDGAKKDEEDEKKRKKRKTSGKENANTNSNNKNGSKSSATKIVTVAKGSLAEAFPPITASMEQISLREENDAAKKGSLEPTQFDQVAAMSESADNATAMTTPVKKKNPVTTGTEDGAEINENHHRFFALKDPSKSVSAPSTPEEKAEKSPPARSSRSTKKTTPTLPSVTTKKRGKLSSTTPTNTGSNNNKGSNKSKTKPKTSRRTPEKLNGEGGQRRRKTSIIKKDAFRGIEDDTLTLLCAAADRLESLFPPAELGGSDGAKKEEENLKAFYRDSAR
ncbi:predicted protein [Bathycoccus prasinos]|uniref:Uncharacterized protein n=1 Tax=Bathycoccus prasinos TaxID=41875 RepID=K8EBH4_9CHLO|nr:predicted protein [Bathycoccus prasinos]CCO15211.1 predicted protein [Bathycoccus prasinos]|eukprot:XP_007514971.1 predicted protein [Bathycoccus prasinos]